MTRNRLKAKSKVLNSKAAGEVIMDVMLMYYKVLGIAEEPLPQIVKNVVGIVKKSYKDQMSTIPVEERVHQVDIETAIKDAKEGKY